MRSNNFVRAGVESWPNISTHVAFLFGVLIGGGNAVAVRFSNFELPPFWGAAIRFASAALLFWLIVFSRRITLPEGHALAGTLLYGLLNVGASYAFIYWGLVRIQASLAALVLATTPLITHLLALGHGLEKYNWRRLAGALIALAGIRLAIGGGLGTIVPLLSLLSLIAGAACFAEGSVVFKLLPLSHPVATNALALTTGALSLIGLSAVAGEEWSAPTTPRTWFVFIYLVLIGTVVSFYLFLFVLMRWTASATTYSFLLIPVATVFLAAWLAGEAITAIFLIGSVVVLAGVWLGVFSGSPGEATSGKPPDSDKALS